MRRLLALLCVLGISCLNFAADEKKPDPKSEDKAPTLAIGDPAPPLKVTKWMQGKEVTSFQAGQVYVVEFWATWCGPCIVMMPHVSELQDEYRDRGVTVVGFSAKDPNNSEEKVAAFVEKRGKKLHYTLAYADDRDTYNAYMRAAKQNGIPCCYVVDKAGKIAFIGHPMLLDDVLPKVVAGTWNGKDDAEAIEKGREEFREVVAAAKESPEAGIKAFDAFQAKRPNLAKSVFYAPFKLSQLLKLEKYADAKTEAERLLVAARKHEDGSSVIRIAAMFMSPTVKLDKDKDLQAFVVRTAEDAVKFNGDKDAMSLILLADAHFAAGDKAKAKEFGAKALSAAETRQKTFVESRFKKYDADEKKD